MKTPLALLPLVLALLAPSLWASEEADGRTLTNLDAGWRFLAGDDPRASAAAFDDASWQAVNLPHTWNALDGEDGGGNYRRGAGWYRRHVVVPAALAGRRLYLRFDGASLMADVYVNGIHLGNHTGGFARFLFDATGALRTGADNVLAVRVDNGSLGIPPNDADFTICGGIYRGVWLLATDPVQVSVLDMGSPGVFVEEHDVGADRAGITVRAELENHGGAPREVDVRIAVLDAAGAPFGGADATLRVHLDPSGRKEVLKPFTLGKPRLWDGKRDPYLYTVRVEVRPVAANGAAGPLSDAVEEPLGLRSFAVDPQRGFILNGHPLDLRGFNRHQDRIDKGWAISDADEAEDFAIMLETGATAVRVSHYQQADSWYTRCDRAGIVAWAEIPSWGLGLATPEYLESAKQQLRELIRQNFNHPAVFFWGVGNETRGPASDAVVVALNQVVHEEDPGRLSTYASNHDNKDTKNWHTDVVAFNRYYGWYSGELPEFAAWLDRTHADYPGARFGMSEFGAGASIYQHADPAVRPAPRGPFHPEEYQDAYHEAYWTALKDRPYVWCKFIWCLFDFASDGRNEGDHPGRNDKGLVTYDRKTRKDAFFFYKANWSQEPVLYIAGRRFTERKEPVTDVTVYSNAPEVTLSLNGVSLGARTDPGNRVFRWAGVRLSPGKNLVRAVAGAGAPGLEDSCAWTLKAP
jgi:beta-galactosidase